MTRFTTATSEVSLGVDANASKDELYRQARQLGVRGRSPMSKNELVEALRKASERETARARAK